MSKRQPIHTSPTKRRPEVRYVAKSVYAWSTLDIIDHVSDSLRPPGAPKRRRRMDIESMPSGGFMPVFNSLEELRDYYPDGDTPEHFEVVVWVETDVSSEETP